MSGAAVSTFSFEGAEIRTLVIEDEPWWVAADVCGALDIQNSRDALSTLDDDEKGVGSTDTLGGSQQMSIINESGLYSLILRSRKPEAKAFKRWVTHEVLPAIRRTGRYEGPARAERGPLSADDVLAIERQMRVLGSARRAGVMTNDEVRGRGLEFLATFGLAPESRTLDEQHDAETVEWLHRYVDADAEVSLRDIFRGLNGRAWVRRSADVEPVVARLVVAGHLRALPIPPPRRGRPPSPRFEVLTSPDRPYLTVVRTEGAIS